MKRLADSLAVVAVATVCLAVVFELAPLGAQAPVRARQRALVTALADEYVAVYTLTFPEAAELLGFPVERHDGLTDNSAAATVVWQAKEDEWSARLSSVKPDDFRDDPEWFTYGFLKEALDASRGIRVCRYDLWPSTHLSNWARRLTEVAASQPVGTERARRDVVARWRRVPRYLANEVASLREGLRLGYTLPRASVRLLVGQLDALLALPVEQSPFYAPATRSDVGTFRTALRVLLEEEVRPAIREYVDFLRGTYMAGARDNLPITALPNGAECYRASSRYHTTIDRSPEETMRVGMVVVEANRQAIVQFGKERFGLDDPAAILERIQNEPSERFSSREEVLAFARETVTRAQASMPRAFARLPSRQVTVEPYARFQEVALPGDSYEPGHAGRGETARYRVLLSPQDRWRARNEATAFHEAYPGHHLQFSIAAEMASLHPIARVALTNAFTEGWGRYAEVLAEELGLYSSPYGRVARLGWPARAMVVDPGLHVFGWSNEQAEKFVAESGRTGRLATAQVLRIAVGPGENTAYDTGGLEILALRDRARRELGNRFDLREFHDVVLRHGAITLSMLRSEVERWLERRKAVMP